MESNLLEKVTLATGYCSALENIYEYDKTTFINEMLRFLPRLYIAFSPDSEEETNSFDYGYYQTYVDEALYEEVRKKIESLMGEDDVFLETFEEDMKYSDTPIAASISESLADIFQPLYNFISVVRESDGEEITGAFFECRENFESYWSQTLCNVLRALNNLKYKP